MAVPNSTPISFAEIRAEGNKTSWVSPAYPTVGRLYNIDPNWMMSVDENNQIGLNPSDGSFSIAQMQGWDTWSESVINNADFMQFKRTQDLRVYFEVAQNDPFRTGYAIYRTSSKPNSWGDLSATTPDAIVQHGNEFSLGQNNKTVGNRVYYNVGGSTYGDSDLQVLRDYNNDFPGKYSEKWGHKESYDVPLNYLVDFNSFSENDLIGFSVILRANVGVHYVTIVPFDGRQKHTLGAARNDNNFNTGTNANTSITSYNRGSLKNIKAYTGSGVGAGFVRNDDYAFRIVDRPNFDINVEGVTINITDFDRWTFWRKRAQGLNGVVSWSYQIKTGATDPSLPANSLNGWSDLYLPSENTMNTANTTYYIFFYDKGGTTNNIIRKQVETGENISIDQMQITSSGVNVFYTDTSFSATIEQFQYSINGGNYVDTGPNIIYDGRQWTGSTDVILSIPASIGDEVMVRARLNTASIAKYWLLESYTYDGTEPSIPDIGSHEVFYHPVAPNKPSYDVYDPYVSFEFEGSGGIYLTVYNKYSAECIWDSGIESPYFFDASAAVENRADLDNEQITIELKNRVGTDTRTINFSHPA